MHTVAMARQPWPWPAPGSAATSSITVKKLHNTDLLLHLHSSRAGVPHPRHYSEHLRQLQRCLRHHQRVRARSRPATASLVRALGVRGAAIAARRRGVDGQAREHREEHAQRRRGQHAVQEQLVGQQVPAQLPPVSGARMRGAREVSIPDAAAACQHRR